MPVACLYQWDGLDLYVEHAEWDGDEKEAYVSTHEIT